MILFTPVYERFGILGVFVFLSILDYREQPSAQNRTQMEAYIDMMKKEQNHRLRAMYPEQYDERSKCQ